MRLNYPKYSVRLKALLIGLAVLLVSLPSLSQEIPGFDQQVVLNAKGESANDFVYSLFGQIGVPVSIESEIFGKVDGKFEGSAEEVFEQISRMFNVHVYFNRSKAYVYPAHHIIERFLPMSNAKAASLMGTVKQLNLMDSRNAVYAIKNAGVEVVGNERFVNKVEELAASLKVPQKERKKKVATPAAQPTAKQIVVREFKLKHVSVIDTVRTIGGVEVLVPGVESMLNRFINGSQSPAFVTVESENSSKPINRVTNAPASSSSDFVTRILVNPQNNSVWIEDTADRMSIYQAMIDGIDQEPKQVEIEATIIDINNTRQQELGINWRMLNGSNELLFGNGSGQDLLLNPGQNITPFAAGGTASMILGSSTQFIARIRALEDLGAANIVSKPHVLTQSNSLALISATTEFDIKLEGKEEVGLEQKSYGTSLQVTPRVYENGAVDGIYMNIVVEDGNKLGSAVDNLPELEKSRIKTQAMILNGQSLLIGGLIRETENDLSSKVPLLGDIPAIGKLFQSNRRSSTTTERLVLITPKIVGPSAVAGTEKMPVLLGDMEEIIDTSERRVLRAREQIRNKSFANQQRLRIPKQGVAVQTVGVPATQWQVRAWEDPENSSDGWQAVAN